MNLRPSSTKQKNRSPRNSSHSPIENTASALFLNLSTSTSHRRPLYHRLSNSPDCGPGIAVWIGHKGLRLLSDGMQPYGTRRVKGHCTAFFAAIF